MYVQFYNYGKRALLGALVIFTLLVMPVGVLAQAGGPSDPAEMEAFFDGIMLSHLEADHIPGVTLVVVKDGEIFFSKGYGHADVEQEITVDPARTLFRIGSVSKLFTWTAVMQLVEQGLLDLDADVNNYLDFEIPATYPQPITMRHLLSHTAGFEDRGFEMEASNAESLLSNGDWLKVHIPARVRPAGSIISYSNYGASLAGYIVERVAGMSFADYLEAHITGPLGMEQTSIRQPLPEALAGDMSQGYQFVGGRPTTQDFELLNVAPAGSISASGEDMARFMIAHLQDGRYAEAQILQEETAQQMQSRLFTPDARLNGMAYGFFEEDRGEQRIIGHGGDTTLFHSHLSLLLDERIGLFVSCNSVECGELPHTVLAAFFDHYYPLAPTSAPMPTSDFATRANLVTGHYRMNRMSYTTAEKALSLLSSVKVSVQHDELVVSPGDMHLVEISPFVYQLRDGSSTLVFSQDDQGKVTHAFMDGAPLAFERVPWLDTPLLHYGILGFVILLSLSVLIGGPLVFFARWGLPVPSQPKLARVARWVLAGAFLLCLLFMLFFILSWSDSGQMMMTGQLPLQFAWAPTFALIVGLACAVLVFTVLAWKNCYWNLFARVHYSLGMLAAWAFVWFVNYWHLLRW